MAMRPEAVEAGAGLLGKDPFINERTPWFLKQQEHGGEKRAYIRTVGHLAAEISQSSDLPFAVLGAGGGWESFEMAKALRKIGKTNQIVNFDINDEALREIRKRAMGFKKPLPELAENLICGDLGKDLPLKKEGFALVFLSSVLHEVQSADGWKAVVSAFKRAEEILAPGGLLVVREFLPPERARAIVKLNTPWAKRFFENFSEYFRQGQKQERDNEWIWDWVDEGEKDQILTDSRFVYEIFLHARTFKRECDRLREDRAFAFFPSWRELKERYTLTTENFDPHMIAHDLIETSGEPEGHWAFFPHAIPVLGREVDFLEEQFSYFTCRPDDDTRMTKTPVELKRMWIFFHRHPLDIHEPGALEEREGKLGDLLDDLRRQSFRETLVEEMTEAQFL